MARRFSLGFLALSILGGSLPAGAGGPSSLTELAESRAWLRLLHYRERWGGGYQSDVDSPEFFFASDGATNPRAELEAAVRVFSDPVEAVRPRGVLQHAAGCAFPARRAFLERSLGRAFPLAADAAGCSELTEWKAGIAARSISVVFSSAYPNNPASMFGHTLIRLNRQPLSARLKTGDPEVTTQADLLSYGVNFSAQIPDHENPVKYALYGLIGNYRGRFDLAPYYRKVNEYSLSESRDLWEYDLGLSDSEVETLVDHLWELYGNGFFDYYFLDENCSFQILTLLEAAVPRWNLTHGFLLTVVPAETLKRLRDEPGAIVRVTRRPSAKNRRAARVQALNAVEVDRLFDLLRSTRGPVDADSTPLLDAAIAALGDEQRAGDFPPARAALLREVLVARARKGPVTSSRAESESSEEEKERPDRSHGTSRLFFGARAETRAEDELRFGVSGFAHTLLDPTPAYNRFSEVEVLRIEFARANRRHAPVSLADASIISMASFADHAPFDPAKSWRVGIRWREAWTVSGGYGLGRRFLADRNLIYLLASGVTDVGPKTGGRLRIAPGLDFGILLQPSSDPYFIHADAEALVELTGVFADRVRAVASVTQAYTFSQAWQLRLDLRLARVVEGGQHVERTGNLSAAWFF